MEFLDFTSLTLAEFQQLVPPFEPPSNAIWRRGGWMGNSGRARRFSPCTTTAPSQAPRIGYRYSDVCQDLRAASGPGALFGMVQSKANRWSSRPLAHPPRGTPRPRGCSCPLPHGPGTAPRCPGGCRGDHDRTAGGGAYACGHWSRCRTSGPPFAHDGTARRIVHPQDPPAQTECYSGKKKDHTVKNVLLVNALLIILFLSDTYGGRVHDRASLRPAPTHFQPGVGYCRIWASWRSRSLRWRSSCRPRNPAAKSCH